jgi:thiamine biosynthesis lipoprotein
MRRVLPIVLIFSLLCGCGVSSVPVTTGTTAETVETAEATTPSTSYVFAMDTIMTLTVYGDDSLLKDAETEIQRLEALLSVTDESSDIGRLNRDGEATLDAETVSLLSRTLAISDETGGALDPTAYSLVHLWGFTTDEYHVPSQAEITETLTHVGADKVILPETDEDTTVRLTDGAQIDLGAVVKGYTGQKLAALAEEAGVCAALFQLGGNVQTYGLKPDGSAWRVAIQDPADESAQSAILNLPTDGQPWSVVTSGVYQRYFEENGVRYHHIMDTATGAPADSGLASVTIVCNDGLLADALSTALLVMGLDDGSAFWRSRDDFEAVFIDNDGGIFVTEGLTDCIEADSFTTIGRNG